MNSAAQERPSSAAGGPVTSPVTDVERLPVMDVLRGFALLGIFLMNIEFFNRALQEYGAGVAPGQGLDTVAGLAIYALVQGKFWVLFALLFGMGFALMRERARAAGRPFVGLYLRRTALLMLFGVLHITLLWVGDILLAYGISALFLLAMMWLRGRAALVVGAALYLLTSGLWLLSGVGMMFMPETMLGPVQQQMAAMVADGAQATTIYREGGFAAVTAQRIDDYVFMLTGAVVFQIPMMLGVFLVGTWLVGTGRLADPAAHRGFFTRMAVGGLVLGSAGVAAALSVGTHFDLVEQFAESTVALGLMAMANLPMALGYLGLVVLATIGPVGRWLSVLAPAGRMALTNYLMQSLVASLVFYGYGLGLFGELGRAAQVGFVVVVFAAQVAFSRWWLARFRFGPLEWLWRAGTYLTLPPMRRSADA
jgi:uncharacterized protein